jgi:hypothetical protein
MGGGGGGFQRPEAQDVKKASELGMSLPEYKAFQEKQRKTRAELSVIKEGRAEDLAEGRKRGEELFGKGSLSDIEGRRASEIADIIERRKKEASGFSPEEQEAMKSGAVQNIQQATQANLRQLRGIQGAQGIRGGLAAAQQAQALQKGQEALAGAERDLFLQNIAQRRAGTEALEKSIQAARAEELGAARAEKQAQLATELGFASLGAAERGAVMQKLVGEAQAQAAGRSGGGGKK